MLLLLTGLWVPIGWSRKQASLVSIALWHVKVAVTEVVKVFCLIANCPPSVSLALSEVAAGHRDLST